MATLTKPEASKIEVTSATLSSTITVPSGVEVTEKGICYSIFSTKPATDGQHTVDSSQGNAISVNLKDLNEGATYYATAYATTRDGTFYSEATQFTLGRTYEPTVAISEVTGVGETEATVNATIKTDGGRDITEKESVGVVPPRLLPSKRCVYESRRYRKQLQPETDFADQRTEILRTCLRQKRKRHRLQSCLRVYHCLDKSS